MYDIKILEEEWKRYKRKKYRPWVIGSVLLISIIIASLFLVDFSSLFSSFVWKEKKEVNNTTVDKNNIMIDGALIQLENKNISIATEDPLVEVSSESDIKDKKELIQEKKTLAIQVVEANDSRAYKEVEKRFRLGHDIDDSLFLAKSYYANGQYKKAEYWALQTNKIDENVEESWLIFIKSKVKRGQKNEALRILNTYIKRTHSAEAKVLLEKIKKGRL